LPDAIDELRKAIVLDPLSAEMSSWVARFLLYSKDYEGAITQGQKTLELDEQSIRSTLYIGSAHLALGDAKTALEWYRRGQGMERAVRSYDAHIARALAALGERDEADEILRRLEDESRQHYVRGEVLAMGYAAVGDFDKAFAALERAYQARSAGLIYLHLDPGYEPLRADPRYAELVRRIGLR
jgi:tetratricopeptide (TPR) repeat protein